MLSLHTNAAALSTQNSLSSTQKALSTSMTRLGTGYRVNSAMDDAAGLQIATRLDSQTRGMAVAQRNTQNGISMLQTADGAMAEVSNILLRMKDLATESANATSSADDKTALKAEFDQLGAEITNIMGNTTFGGAKLLTGGTLAASIDFQIGASTAEVYSVDVSAAMGGITVPTAIGAAADIDTINTALTNVGTFRSAVGAAANRLDHVYNNLQNISSNVSAARGRIMDTDYAAESSTMTTKQMLQQSGTAMLKQSNSMSGLVMSLLG